MAWLSGDGGSLLRRVDAISIDYLTRPSVGPEAVSDSSRGALVRPWQIDAKIPGEVWLSRGSHSFLEDDWTGSSWEPATQLFTYSGSLFVEIDLAFDQNGAPVVVGQRYTGENAAPELWIYFYDSLATSYQLVNFGPGRTPRTVLDDPLDESGGSDVVVFYLDPSTHELKFRQQRDRYEVVYTIGSEYYLPRPELFLEEAAQGSNSRVQLWLSNRNDTTGRFTREKVTTLLYPVRLSGDVSVHTPSAISILLKRELWETDNVETYSNGPSILELRLSTPIIEQAHKEEQYALGSPTIRQLTLSTPIVESKQKDTHYTTSSPTVVRLEIDAYIIEHKQPTESQYHANGPSVQLLQLNVV